MLDQSKLGEQCRKALSIDKHESLESNYNFKFIDQFRLRLNGYEFHSIHYKLRKKSRSCFCIIGNDPMHFCEIQSFDTINNTVTVKSFRYKSILTFLKPLLADASSFEILCKVVKLDNNDFAIVDTEIFEMCVFSILRIKCRVLTYSLKINNDKVTIMTPLIEHGNLW